MLLDTKRLRGFSFAVLICITAKAQQPSFPGAEGAGGFTTGGRGTQATATTVFEVTSLDDTNTPGTLRYAIQATATYRTIVFRVAGTIHLTSPLNIKANTTIAGQSAPGDGICLADYPVKVNGNNVIVRYIRCRLGDKNQNEGMVDGSGDDDALDGTNRNNVIIDHCSVSWSDDEALTFYDGDNVTLQWNIISEPLNYSYHFETGDADFEHHGYGGIWGGQHASFHHNLIAHCLSRTPRLNGSRYFTPLVENAELVNNVIYNWGSNNVYGGEGGNYNIVGNYYKYGPSTTAKNRIVNPNKQTSAPVLPFGMYYITGNYMDGSATVNNNNWRGVVMGNGAPTSDTSLIKTIVPFSISTSSINVQSADDAYNDVLLKAGTSLPNRDTLDERIINDVKNRTGKIIDVQGGFPHGTAYALTVNAWPFLAAAPAPADNDHDGMADEWELQRGLDPSNAADRNGYHANGYTNLENYLNGDSIVAQGILDNCVQARSITASGGNTWLFAKDTTYTKFISTDTMNVVAAIKDDGNYGDFTVSYYTASNTRYYSNGRPYLNRNITITPANPGAIGGPVTVRLFILKSEFDSLKAKDASIATIADLRVLKTAENNCPETINTVPEIIVPSVNGQYGTYGMGYFLEFTTSSFSTFFIGGPDALPLKLVSFTGNLVNNSVMLKWATANETGVKYFSVEKSSDGSSFNAIQSISPKGESKNAYSASDLLVGPFVSQPVFYYRLKLFNIDGSFFYSNVVRVDGKAKGGIWVSPNPAKGQAIVYHPRATVETVLRMATADGRQVLEQKIPAGATQTKLLLSFISHGMYLITVIAPDEVNTMKLFVD